MQDGIDGKFPVLSSYTNRSIAEKISQPNIMHAGIVTTQAVTMRPAMPQRTAEALLVAPTPRMAEEITWVVETGMPSRLANSMIEAAAVSAAKPSIDRNSTTFSPIVRIMRQPPNAVPSPIAVAAASTTQSGTSRLLLLQP